MMFMITAIYFSPRRMLIYPSSAISGTRPSNDPHGISTSDQFSYQFRSTQIIDFIAINHYLVHCNFLTYSRLHFQTNSERATSLCATIKCSLTRVFLIDLWQFIQLWYYEMSLLVYNFGLKMIRPCVNKKPLFL